MASIFDVANFFLQNLGPISVWKLQKLCYYAQAWSLAWTATPLFNENFEAWSNGPVCPKLFHELQDKFTIYENDLHKGSIAVLTEEQLDTLSVVLKDYGNLEPYELREMTRNEDPWLIARNGLPDGTRCNNIIKKSEMGREYGSL